MLPEPAFTIKLAQDHDLALIENRLRKGGLEEVGGARLKHAVGRNDRHHFVDSVLYTGHNAELGLQQIIPFKEDVAANI
jgi:hypothetical protein